MSSKHAKPWNFVVEWIQGFEFVVRGVKRVYAHADTTVQEILVAELEGLGKSLIIDGKVQSSLFDEYWYHEALVHPVMIAHPCPRRVLIVGGGEGATLREVLKHTTVQEVVMVDLDYEMVKVARELLHEWHQGSFSDVRVDVVAAEGRHFVESCRRCFDVVILDLVDPVAGEQATRLYTLEFYQQVRKLVNEGGIVVTQATSPVLYPKAFAAIRNALRRVFKIAVAYVTFVKSYNGLWGFVAASDKLDPSRLSAEEVEERVKLRVRGELRFYDGVTHTWMFSLPKPLRRLLDEVSEVSTDENPATIPP